MSTDISINNRFKQVRQKLGMSQEEFGKAIGLSKSGVSNIENGGRGLRDAYINIVCSTFNVNNQWLRTGAGEIFASNPTFSMSAFEEYIKSLGYTLEVSVSTETQASCFNLAKNGIQTSFTQSEFESFQASITDSVEFQVWKQRQK